MRSDTKPRSHVPVTVLTGYLGSGKTTLLNHLLSQKLGPETAVIVNEFGAISIDADLVVGVDEDVLQINNGCICCTVRGDLVATIARLLEGERPVRCILIETTGLADPAPIIQSFMVDEALRATTRLDAVVTVADASNLAHWLADPHAGENVAREQLAFADVIVVSKGDLVERDSMRGHLETIARINPMARVVHAEHGVVDADALLDLGAFDLKNALAIEPALLSDLVHEHDDAIASVEVRLEKALDGDAFFRWLNAFVQAKGGALLRVKGIVDVQDESRRFVFQGVHMTLDGRPGRPWSRQETRRTTIVFIGRDLDVAEIRRSVADCTARSALVA